MTYKVKTEAFEGPLDLLLSLIEKKKLFINDVSLSQVADDYIEYLKALEEYPARDISHFVLIASTLVLIKSKSLLPALSFTAEEEGSMEDLEERLKAYQRVKELSVHVNKIFGATPLRFRIQPKQTRVVFSPDKNTALHPILEAALRVIQNVPKEEVRPQAQVRKIIRLEEVIQSLTDRVQSALKMSFKEFSGLGKQKKIHVIVSFIALLELVKQGIIAVKQNEGFGDIDMEAHEVGVPRYDSTE